MPHILEKMTVLDPEGAEVQLGRLWADRTAVLVFIRHFGCVFSRQQVAEIGLLDNRVRSLGGEIVVIGHGTLEEMRAFQAEAGSLRLFTDPTRQAYRAMNLRRGPRSVMTVSVLRRSIRAWLQGFRQSTVAGDPFQQGGVVVVDPSGRERYRFISREAGEHPPASDILAALA
jgi:hypothetical protein